MTSIAERAATSGERERIGERVSRLRVAILADPVFTPDDPRVKVRGPGGPGPAGDGPSALDTSLRGTGRSLASLPRLLASREEAASIARAAVGTDVTITTDFRVDRARAEETLADSYQVVHFATHGVLNDEHPLLSGIVTSLVDEGGHRRDGFLRARDVYDSHVGAELVVLSACETALGMLLRGEGITGLVHAFLHAGAGTIVASNWRVEDAATQELMVEFYRSLLVGRVSASAALRAAQIELLRRRRTRAPFFWAAFEVHGLSPRFSEAVKKPEGASVYSGPGTPALVR
jgi:CHAT domain-containing protein